MSHKIKVAAAATNAATVKLTDEYDRNAQTFVRLFQHRLEEEDGPELAWWQTVFAAFYSPKGSGHAYHARKQFQQRAGLTSSEHEAFDVFALHGSGTHKKLGSAIVKLHGYALQELRKPLLGRKRSRSRSVSPSSSDDDAQSSPGDAKPSPGPAKHDKAVAKATKRQRRKPERDSFIEHVDAEEERQHLNLLKTRAQARGEKPSGDDVLLRQVREGQSAFRRGIVERDGGACIITGCVLLETLDAAHIIPYAQARQLEILGHDVMDTNNGMLVRADVHRLYDAGSIWIELHAETPLLRMTDAVAAAHPELAARRNHKVRRFAQTCHKFLQVKSKMTAGAASASATAAPAAAASASASAAN